ncbi:pyruvate dehydrogenase (acetyl-transferring), homodimeric type [Pontiellaceae bacterium B12227]|nr:pyruvate dehydrogenase (acetyl-transferring), homodimeric type [Pontiellaceae bacterium B12227]
MDTSNSNTENVDYDKQDWLDALDEMLENEGPERVKDILHDLQVNAHRKGVRLPFSANTPYINTIPLDEQPAYPGDREMERRIKSLIRWNAMAMVVKANREEDGIGGHISSYQSIATMYEVGFNHFFRGRTEDFPGDLVYFQGHSSPGVYARAYLEGRLSDEHLLNFRHELHDSPGLSSYPHPWLMPDFWQFPTVSMGLGPITAIYHARYIKYLEDRGLREPTDQQVWAFLGDGETDEPESLGALKLAAREKLDNLTFVVNCNLQRLDGPVSGNGKIIQELEAAFRGAGWNVIKVVWGDSWDPLLEKDEDGLLVKRMGEVVDGQYQKYTVEDADYVREHFFNTPELKKLVEHLSDTEIKRMRRGGHDPAKVYAAYKAAQETKDRPTVILSKTVKGYGLGAAGEGQNITHSQKKMGEDSLREFRTRFGLPISDEDIDSVPFYRPPEDSPEMQYLKSRRSTLGGHVPTRLTDFTPIEMPADKIFQEFDNGSDRPVSTTMVFVRVLSKLLSDKNIGKLIVPIVPDEARTFGMDALFRQVGIYAHSGQQYEPVDADNLLYYKEEKDGQILEEGITEAGAFSSFVAAGTAYANHNINTIPFYTYYSMFGFQRIGDSAWLAGDARCKGFLMGATAGRTTLAGEGLQHQDGHGLVLALTIPNLVAYDPAYAYELAIIIKEGIRRMYVDNEQIFYYITLMNANYEQPAMPEGAEEGILKGLYKFQSSEKAQAQILGSGAILPEAVMAAELLKKKYKIETNVWSVTSYKNLINDVLDAEREKVRNGNDVKPYITECLEGENGPVIAASDYMKLLPTSLAQAVPGGITALGTDGFGRSDGRPALRKHFEVDANAITFTVLSTLADKGEFDKKKLEKARKDLGIDSDKPNPVGE